MKTVEELLRETDPLRTDPPSAGERERIRRLVVDAARSADANPARRMGRRVVLVGGIVALAAAAAVGAKVWPAGATLHAAAVRFEIRLAESAPTLDLTPARVAGSDRVVYLHRDALVTNEDIAAARVVPATAAGQFNIGVRFTPAAGEMLRAATADHIGRPLALTIDGEVVMAPTLRSSFGAEALLTGNYTKAEADRIANGMLMR